MSGTSGGGTKLVIAGVIAVAMASGVKHAGGELATLTSATASSTSSNHAVKIGRKMAAKRGWTGGQFQCLNWLWTRESGWSNTAENAKSGAYGIAQALGHGPTNQYPAGPANPPQSDARAQISWGLAYVAGRYGTPCNAWDHETSYGWY